MDDDIQFGEIEESSPGQHLRPDRNKHFAVVGYEEPREGELPIFVDLDVMRDMETHAQSDTSVELGGVLLGGQYEDEDGQPFVMITDSLRAEHYEATKGSFKFTHDTWEQITREREDFPPELQMVGWYHTHPDWGVFLSGMDMFICDNFFNRPLDVALVIDPCRGDRGMFQWTGDPRERVRRTRGFYLISSRFRREELEEFAQLLEGKINMAAESRSRSGSGFSSSNAPVVHITQPSSGPQYLAVLALMTVQFAVLALLAWQLLKAPAGAPETAQEKQIAAWNERLDQLESRRAEAEKIETQLQVLRQVMDNLSDEPALVQSLERLRQENARLESQSFDRVAAERQNRSDQERLAVSLETARTDIARLNGRLKDKSDDIAAGEAKRVKLLGEMAVMKKELAQKKADETGFSQTFWWILGGVVLLFFGVLGVMVWMRPDDSEPDKKDPATGKESSPPANNSREGESPADETSSGDRPSPE
ncbi:Mov34/MPN/PAD-1 family protein [Lignipirellula cremea]|uniref:Mov34/MPN/PAD-1 family protein n=1 Tax=Lignipirellula cremea TaxID=2528010 RepID=A0A518DSR6_9BACT|nr:Mov34/MPN/PAD-1 family protein [Lignipirellula cremea]QDU94885.1 Mov34/MPN/PAD-1 family protein [Lignipirellula cremea]